MIFIVLLLKIVWNEVQNRITKLKQKFGEFEISHTKYHDALEEEAAIDDSEEYFSKVQLNYIENLSVINKYVKANKQDVSSASSREQSSVQPASSDSLSRQEVMDLMHLPKVEIEVFSGDPLKYHCFMSVFDEHVHPHKVSDKLKLT